jgi:hypothetical protein
MERKMKKSKSFLIIISALALSTVFCGCSDKANTSSGNDVVFYDESNSYVDPGSIDSQAKADAQQVQAEIGKTAVMQNVEINFEKMINITYPKDTTSVYAGVFEIKNNSDKEINVTSLGNFNVTVDGGLEMNGASVTGITRAMRVCTDLESFNGTIAAGQSLKGFITFETEKKWEEAEITFRPKYEEDSYDRFVYKVTPDMAVDAE